MIKRIGKKLSYALATLVLITAQMTPFFVLNSGTASAATECTNDLQGVNDEPGQKDLTQMCFDDENSPTSVGVSWQWDEIAWTGNNTGDGCALFDEDDNDNADYAFCVIVGGDPAKQITGSPKVYKCNDSREDRCAGKQLVSKTYLSTCSVVQGTDPFVGGTGYPKDTKAVCTIYLSDFSTTTAPTEAELIDVCSYPSQEPNSDPSDCIVAETTNTTTVELIKIVSPLPNSSTFDLSIEGVKYVDDGPSGSTTGAILVSDRADIDLLEAAGQGSNIDDFTTTISCIDQTGVSFPVSSVTNNTTAGTRSAILDSGDIAKGDNIICTFTNTRKTGNLKVVKDVINDNGGNKTSANFTFKVNGGVAQTFVATTGDDGERTLSLPTGTYTVVEPEANTMGYSTSYNNCSNVVVVSGQTQICTITNNDIAPKLTLNKSVTNDNGGSAQPDDFKLTVGGNAVQSGVKYSYAANTPLVLNETQLEGQYTFSSLTGDAKCPKVLGGTVTLVPGDDISCTITNNDVAPSLTLVKKVINYDGGKRTAAEWNLTATGSSENPTNIAGNGGASSGTGFKADTYTLAESGPTDYSPSLWTCTNGVTVVNSQITLTPGKNTTCTITNDDDAPTLTLIKLVTNNSGGSTIASAWTLIAQAGTSDPVINEQGAIVPDSYNKKAQTSTVSVSAGIFYTLSESGPGGYTPGAWSCDGGTLDDGAVMLALDTSVTCTIVNDDDAPMLEVGKRVINDNSGTELSEDFNLYVNGVLLTDARKGGGDISDNGIWYLHADTKANTVYTITEDQKLGYENTDLECVDLDTKQAVSHPITLALGQRISCTLTNDDIPNPSLSVEKYGPETAFEGETVTYTIYVTNDGDVNLMNVDVEDALIEQGVEFLYSNGDDDEVLEIGEMWVFTGTYTIPENTVENVINTVNVCADMYEKYAEWTDMRQMSVLMNEEIVRDACGSAVHELDVVHPGITVVKTGPASASAGATVVYTFTVTNSGDVALSGIAVEDSITGTGTYVSGDDNKDGMLDLEETWVYTANYTIPQNQVAPVVNTVEACGSYNLRQVEQESEDARSAAVATSVEVCAEDSHTLRIPQVLGSSTTVVPKTPAPAVLATTGTNTTTSVLAGISLIIAAIFVTFLGVKTTTSSDK